MYGAGGIKCTAVVPDSTEPSSDLLLIFSIHVQTEGFSQILDTVISSVRFETPWIWIYCLQLWSTIAFREAVLNMKIEKSISEYGT